MLVGIIGSRRRIGFGWAFLLSVIFTPLVGLVIALLTDPLPGGDQRRGCIGTFVAVLGMLFLAAFPVLPLTGGNHAAGAFRESGIRLHPPAQGGPAFRFRDIRHEIALRSAGEPVDMPTATISHVFGLVTGEAAVSASTSGSTAFGRRCRGWSG